MMFKNRKSAACREFTSENSYLAKLINTASDRFFANIGTPLDYHNLINARNVVYHDMVCLTLVRCKKSRAGAREGGSTGKNQTALLRRKARADKNGW